MMLAIQRAQAADERLAEEEYFDWLKANIPEMFDIQGRPRWIESEEVISKDQALLDSFDERLTAFTVCAVINFGVVEPGTRTLAMTRSARGRRSSTTSRVGEQSVRTAIAQVPRRGGAQRLGIAVECRDIGAPWAGRRPIGFRAV